MLVLVALILSSGLLWGFGRMMGGNMARHHQRMMGGVPAPFRGVRNPLPANEEVIRRGAELFQANCAVCHGEQGYGDGPAGKGLSPPPANINRLMRMPMMALDDYLFWTISDGGKSFGSAMPAFRDSLDEQSRWAIIHYLRRLP